MGRNHDSQFKLLFSSPDVVRDLVLGFTPIEARERLDFASLEPCAGAFVGDDEAQRQRITDAIWRVRIDGNWVYLYLLLEFQSRVDRNMAVRIAEYVAMLYRQQIRLPRNDGQPANLPLPPVLPIVIYNGGTDWTAPCELSGLVAPVGDDLLPFQLRQRHLVLDMARHPRACRQRGTGRGQITNLIDYAIEVEHPSSPEAVQAAVTDVIPLVTGKPELERLITQWTCAVLATRSDEHLLMDHIHSIKELPMALAPGYERWLEENTRKSKEEGLEEGLEKGLEKGEEIGREKERRELLYLLLEDRFGQLPPKAVAQVESGNAAEVRRWLLQLQRADNLADVFRLH